MRAIITAAALLVAATLAPMPAAAEQPNCPPNPLTQAHEPWMKMPTGAVDLQTPTPASATNPLMVDFGRALQATSPVVETGSPQANPLTHRP